MHVCVWGGGKENGGGGASLDAALMCVLWEGADLECHH